MLKVKRKDYLREQYLFIQFHDSNKRMPHEWFFIFYVCSDPHHYVGVHTGACANAALLT